MSDIPYLNQFRIQLVAGISRRQDQLRRRRKALVTSLVLLTAVGVLAPAGAILLTGPEESGHHLPENYWNFPLGNAVTVASTEHAGLVFVPHEPARLPDAVRILVTEDDQGPAALREVAWVFDTAEYGRFVILQRIAEQSAVRNEIRELAYQSPGCRQSPAPPEFGPGAVLEECTFGERSALVVQGSYQGLLLEGSTTTSLWWAEPIRSSDSDAIYRYFDDPILVVEVVGPAGEITGEEAVEIAGLV